jgi:hypothetical protein
VRLGSATSATFTTTLTMYPLRPALTSTRYIDGASPTSKDFDYLCIKVAPAFKLNLYLTHSTETTSMSARPPIE